MKKYLILGAAAAVMATMVVLCLQDTSTAANPSFFGKCKEGRTVTACKLPFYFPCYQTVADEYDNYDFPAGIVHGTYCLDDGCWSEYRTYSGSAVQYDFCIPDPPFVECPCK